MSQVFRLPSSRSSSKVAVHVHPIAYKNVTSKSTHWSLGKSSYILLNVTQKVKPLRNYTFWWHLLYVQWKYILIHHAWLNAPWITSLFSYSKFGTCSNLSYWPVTTVHSLCCKTNGLLLLCYLQYSSGETSHVGNITTQIHVGHIQTISRPTLYNEVHKLSIHKFQWITD